MNTLLRCSLFALWMALTYSASAQWMTRPEPGIEFAQRHGETKEIDKPETGEFFRVSYLPKSPAEVASERYDHLLMHGTLRNIGEDAPDNLATSWSSIGPKGIADVGGIQLSGRVISLAINPINSNIVYLGAASGGLWKSTNAGSSWSNILDTLPCPTIGAIAIPPLATNTVWIGTGSIVNDGQQRLGAPSLGLLYRSTNAGVSWERMPALPGPPSWISRIEIDPWQSNIMFAATDQGLFRSTNSGGTWTLKVVGQISDVKVRSALGNPNSIVVAAVQNTGGLRRSTDAGNTFGSSFLALPGSIQANMGRISIAHSNGLSFDTFYALVHNQVNGTIHGVWRSSNQGANWIQVTTPSGAGGQGWFNNCIAIDPDNPNSIYIGWQVGELFRSSNSGTSWSQAPSNHMDNHVIVVDELNPSTIFIGNDGGVFKSTNGGLLFNNAGGIWLTIAQVYYVTPDPSDPQGEWAGLQDNGIIGGHDGFFGWHTETCCDGGDIAIRLGRAYVTNAGLGWGNTWQARNSLRSFDGFAEGINFFAGMSFPPSPQIIFNGVELYTFLADTVYRTTGAVLPWRPLAGRASPFGYGIQRIGVTPEGRVFAALNNSSQPLRVYNPSTGLWSTPTTSFLAGRTITDFSFGDLVGANRLALISLSGTDSIRVMQSTNNGSLWQNITGDLPRLINVKCVLTIPGNNTRIYIGSDLGVFATTNAGVNWYKVSNGLPAVPYVSSLKYRGFNNEIVAATYGRGLFVASATSPITTVGGEAPSFAFQLLQNYPNPSNPSAIISYTLSSRGFVSLKLFDALGREVATLVSETQDAGHKQIEFNGERLASGVYFYRLQTGQFSETKKLMLIR